MGGTGIGIKIPPGRWLSWFGSRIRSAVESPAARHEVVGGFPFFSFASPPLYHSLAIPRRNASIGSNELIACVHLQDLIPMALMLNWAPFLYHRLVKINTNLKVFLCPKRRGPQYNQTPGFLFWLTMVHIPTRTQRPQDSASVVRKKFANKQAFHHRIRYVVIP